MKTHNELTKLFRQLQDETILSIKAIVGNRTLVFDESNGLIQDSFEHDITGCSPDGLIVRGEGNDWSPLWDELNDAELLDFLGYLETNNI